MDEQGGHATAPHALQLIPQGLRKPRRCKLAGAVVRKAGTPCKEKAQKSAEQNVRVRVGLLLLPFLTERGCQGPSMATQLKSKCFKACHCAQTTLAALLYACVILFPLHSHALPNTLLNP